MTLRMNITREKMKRPDLGTTNKSSEIPNLITKAIEIMNKD